MILSLIVFTHTFYPLNENGSQSTIYANCLYLFPIDNKYLLARARHWVPAIRSHLDDSICSSYSA